MVRVSITVSLALVCCLSLSLPAEGAEAPEIASWSNSKTGNRKTVFQVKPGEKITFTVKAESAENYQWLVDGAAQEGADAPSFKWTAPNRKGMWKILVRTTNKARRQWVKEQALFWDKWIEVRKDRAGKSRPEEKEKFIQGMTDQRLYPSEARKEWIVCTGNAKQSSVSLKEQKAGKVIRTAKVGPSSTSGWESEKSLTEGVQPRVGRGMSTTTFSLGFDVMGDGKWILICGAMHGELRGYYWAGDKWVSDRSRIKGVEKIGGGYTYLAPALIPNLAGDKKWTLIVRNRAGKTFGYYWDRTKWVSDPTRVKGLDVIPGPGTIAVMDNLTGDGKLTLISGSGDGTFKGYWWDGAKWVSDASRVAGLTNVGGHSKPAAGFNVFGEKKWTLIVGNRGGRFAGYWWDGKKWIADPSRVKGIGYGAKRREEHASAALAYNLRGDGRWVLLTGYYYQKSGRGFFRNTVSKEEIPSIKDVASVSAATAARIKCKFDQTWNHRVRYSTKPDMSNAIWSDWHKDTGSPEVRLSRLKPGTTYYYQVYTHVPWDQAACARSSVCSFTTLPARGYVRLNPGQSIQNAIDSLEPDGGIVELLPGTHDVHETVVIDRSNVVIYGPRQAIVRHCNKYVPCFLTPDLKGVDPDLYVENITFRGFTTASIYGTGSSSSMIAASHVRDFTIEDIHDKSWGGSFTGIGARPEHPRYSENVFIRNNTWEHRGILVTHIRNIHVLNNTLLGGRIGTDMRLSYSYVIGNRLLKTHNLALLVDAPKYCLMSDNFVQGGSGIFISNPGDQYALIERNTVTETTRLAAIWVMWGGPMRKVLIRNNLLYNNREDGIYLGNCKCPGEPNRITIVNNIICNSGRDGIRLATDDHALDVSNNIIADSKGYGINRLAGEVVLSHNNIWNSGLGNYNGCAAGKGDFSKDPLFADPANGDFHLKSKAGRWDPRAKKWAKDAVHSPCIDAGDPKDDFSREPAPNGGRVNVGAYGNTKEASKSTAR